MKVVYGVMIFIVICVSYTCVISLILHSYCVHLQYVFGFFCCKVSLEHTHNKLMYNMVCAMCFARMFCAMCTISYAYVRVHSRRPMTCYSTLRLSGAASRSHARVA